ncbi:MAG: adenylate kinase [Patescibacteria group bacterium]|nr:MAG: adenylate kinase [Patescibacteria group bacterium]
MNIIILGLPGSGKGTQSKIISEKLGLFYFEAGAFSRQLAKTDSSIREIVNSGKLIPEKKMTELVFDYLDRNVPKEKDILFDGYPRFLGQFLDLEKWLDKRDKKVDYVVFLEVDEEESIKRLSSRRVCPKCGAVYNLLTNPPHVDNICDVCDETLVQREDDKEEVVRRRFIEYKENVLPLLDFLRNKDYFVKVNGEAKIDEVTAEILERIGWSKK